MASINAQDLRERIGRFRVLIIGRANAGKTTILRKDPEIYDTKGKKIDDAVVKSSIKHGNHDIKNEMVFKSNPVFVFHDSCGFEAGSEEEFDNMKKFISERANTKKLEERIHVIWYCIPMDNPSRTFQRSEEKFSSECDTGHVPVVAVFTKFEALRPFAYGEIKKQLKGLSGEERSKRIAQRVEDLFTNTGVWDRLCDPENHACPKSHVHLENMNQPNTNCNTLLERTTLTLDNEELRLYLVSTQQSNMELCIKHAVTETWKHDAIDTLQPLAAKKSLFTAVNRIIQTSIATIIVLEYSAFLPNNLKNLKLAVNYYLKSSTTVTVEKGAEYISSQGYKKEEVGKKILEFIASCSKGLDNKAEDDARAKFPCF
ncbi:hypothetical protein BDR05DRAFT_956796 [Suillus weaverae]|nr:hypothetical protein BDR05DRAFT_956796 [Suillus weaverae]